MAIGALNPGNFKKPQQKALQTARIPAPLAGIDTRIGLSEGDPSICPYTYNIVPFEYGMRVRKGYREWQIGLDEGSGAGSGVHTIIPFDGIEELGAQDKLFAVTNEGIWDVTIQGDVPVEVLQFITQSDNAGYGVYTHYTTDAGANILFYADSINGLFQYDPIGDTWAQATGITGPVIESIRWVMIHKQRIWLIEENATKAWYLPVGSIAGAAVEFFFGSKFRHGGNLEGLFNWTVDGGTGVDDYLVAVSRSGDVLPYSGTDPSDASWNLRGTYYIGEVPRGPFFGTEHGGNLYLLSSYGITSMGDLLQGVYPPQTAGIGTQSMSGKITSVLRDRMEQSITQFGWEVRLMPSEGALLINTPRLGSGPHIQFFYNLSTQGWGLWRGVPMATFDTWRDRVVFGDADDRILYMDVAVDNLIIIHQFAVVVGVGDGTVEGDVNATDFTGQTPITGTAAVVDDHVVTRFTHDNQFYQWAGLTGVTVGLGGNHVSGASDYNLISPAPNGDTIPFSILTSYQNLGQDGVYKSIKLVRPDFVAKAEPTFTITMRYDYDLSEALPPPSTAPVSGAQWDVGIWDQAVWGAGENANFSDVKGAWGYGRYVAVAMRGEAKNETRLIGWDVMYTVGGPLL